jgi:zona occludens toxin (predicted ATPase)
MTTNRSADYATGVNEKGEVAIFIARAPVRPDGYRLDDRFLTVLAGRAELGTFELEEVAYGAAASHPRRDVTVFEMDENGEVVEATTVRNVRPPPD